MAPVCVSVNDIILFLGVGAVAGTLAGLFGVGGGLVVVPAMVFVFEHRSIPPELLMHLALGSSLASIIATSAGSMRAHHRRGAVDWRLFWLFAPGIVVGGLAGSVVAAAISSIGLQIGFSLFALGVALHMWLGSRLYSKGTPPRLLDMSFAGGVMGAISTMSGIGGGCMVAPYLMWRQVQEHRAIATSASVGLPIAIAGAIGYAASGWNHTQLLRPYAIGYIYWPAVLGIVAPSFLFASLGARIAHRLPPDKLKRGFALFLAVAASAVLIKAF